ncbi:MAG: SGNH/GDSL hydrolase family protein [Lentisphaeria bacterium]|jgi:lysophospholipase L1-like esterase
MLKHHAMRWAAGILVATATAGQCGPLRPVAPDDPRVEYAGYVRKEIVPSPDQPGAKLARFDRILEMAGTGYRWDNPGVSIRFRTDATTVEADLHYSDRHQSKTARNGSGVWAVDGALKPAQAFQTRAAGVQRAPESVTVALAGGEAPGFHDYEIFLPYGDAVDFAGLRVNPEARFEAAKPEPAVRYVAYGDSITHGFTASAVDKTYPFLVGRKKGWRTINLGLGGRSSGFSPSDAGVVGALKPTLVTVLLGVNDWQGGVPLERYRANLEGFLTRFRVAQPETPLYLITPLWVAPAWNPPAKTADLEQYRQVLRDLAAARQDPNLHLIEGPALIDHDPALFDRVAVHPNDKGFAMMAERLAQQLDNPERRP